jgi:hypothetical protein
MENYIISEVILYIAHASLVIPAPLYKYIYLAIIIIGIKLMKTNPIKETLLAFVDEIGDRGHSKKSSEYFAMSAVIFPSSA